MKNIIRSRTFDKNIKKLGQNNRSGLKKIGEFVDDIFAGGPLHGRGSPEKLRTPDGKTYSRRIDIHNRFVYRVEGDVLKLLDCFGHYDDN
jgi:toxin YoeB